MKRTIKRFAAGALVFTALFSLTSCMDILQILLDDYDSGSTGYNVVTATETKKDTYTSSNNIFEVDPYTKTLTVSGLTSGKSIYYAKVNKGSGAVAFNDTRRVDNGTGYSRAVANEVLSLEEAEIPQTEFKHFHAPVISPDEVMSSEASARAVSTGPETKTQISRTVNSTTKDIYVDTNIDIDSFAKKSATLRAKGTYCNVWVVSDCYTTGTAGGKKVDSDIAQQVASKFDAFYPIVRNVYGYEKDQVIYSNYLYSMDGYSDTGTIVNIVLYDIGNDYNSKTKCGVLGYFYSKDYYIQSSSANDDRKYSNQGKYFYVDSEYAVKELNTIVSTLAHEFQHMINFCVKNVSKGIKPDTSYNEMLSMLCEDMMADYLGLSSSESVISARIPGFNTSYFLSGIREYRNDDLATLSYSTSYGFGSWLCRQYGGAALVKEMMQNDYVDAKSMTAAVNFLTGKNYSFDQLFTQFLCACVNKNTASEYTHNQAATQTVTYSSSGVTYSYPMPAINLWNNDYEYPTETNKFLVNNQQSAAYDSSASSFTGPFLFSNNYGMPLRANYGVTLHKIGTIDSNSDTLSLTFSSSGADCVYIYVIIQ